jgi:nitrogen fixation protein FixH
LKPGAWWPIGIVVVLAVTVAANVALMIVARDPHAYVVEPNYYDKGVRWDSTMAQARASVALGWQVDAALRDWTPAGTTLLVQLADSTGAPVAGARVNVELINNVSPEAPVEASPADAGGGRYQARVALARPGLWELRLQARRGRDRFTADLRRDLARAAAR